MAQRPRQTSLALVIWLGVATLLSTAPMSLVAATDGSGVHRVRQIMVMPDRSVSLELAGSASTLFDSYFDLYPVEVSGDLARWAPLITLVRTNRSTNALLTVDPGASGFAQRFYRTPTNQLSTALARPTGPYAVGRTTRVVSDPSRTNRYNIATNSAFMLTVWYPAEPGAGVLPATYIDQPLAGPLAEPHVGSSGDNSSRLAQFRCFSIRDAPLLHAGSAYPVVLYSHGYTSAAPESHGAGWRER